MTTQQILFIVMISIFFLYTGITKLIFGEIASISKSFYFLPGKWRFLFTVFCWSIMILAIFVTKKPLVVIASIGLFYVGGAPEFEKDITGSVHYGGALIAVLFSQLAVAFSYGLWEINLACALLVLFINNGGCKFWNIEVIAFIGLFFAIYLNIF